MFALRWNGLDQFFTLLENSMLAQLYFDAQNEKNPSDADGGI